MPQAAALQLLIVWIAFPLHSHCIPIASGQTPAACQRVLDLAQGVVYCEGLFAAVVVSGGHVRALYALTLNGLVYAMLTSDAAFSNLSKLQRLLT